jgi:O-antigen/teichoic acid export membrane protein
MNKYIKAVSTNLLFFFISTLAFLLLTPIAIHIMGEEFYGLWSVLNAIMIFSTIGTLGINAIITKFASEKNADEQENNILFSGFIIVLPMALLTIIILFLSRSLITDNIEMSSILKVQFRVAMEVCILGIIPQFLSRVPQGFLLSQLKNNIVRTLDLISSVGPLVGGLIICFFEKNLIWIALCYTAIQFLVLFSYLFTIRKSLKLFISPDWLIVRKMLTFSVFTFLESSAIAMFQNLDRVIVIFVLGPAAAGVYSVANSLGTRLSQITGQITDTMIPYASLKNSVEDHETLYRTYRKMSQYISFLMAMIASLGIIWMHEILSVWISPGYAERYYTFFCILILAYALLSLSRSGDQTLTGLGQVKFAAITYLISSILMLSGVYFFSKKFGLLGAGAANLIMVLLLIMNFKTYELLHNKINWKHVLIDLRWGCIFPLLSFVIITFQANLYLKLLSSLLIIAFIVLLNYKDKYLQSTFLKILGKIKGNDNLK